MTEQARQKLKEMMKYCIIYPDGCEPAEHEHEHEPEDDPTDPAK